MEFMAAFSCGGRWGNSSRPRRILLPREPPGARGGIADALDGKRRTALDGYDRQPLSISLDRPPLSIVPLRFLERLRWDVFDPRCMLLRFFCIAMAFLLNV